MSASSTRALAPYARPRLDRGLLDVATSVVPYLLLMAAMVALVPVFYPLALLLAVPAAGFQLRTFIVFHDCAHGSFLPSRRANQWLGRAVGLLVWTPFAAWRHSHAQHHASAGDLDRRGDGDVRTLTVEEYRAAPWRSRVAYRLMRHPAIMFTLGPLYAMVLKPRIPLRSMRPRIRHSVLLTDLAMAAVAAGFCLLFGWSTLLLVQLPMIVLTGGAGVWLFFVQHQFEDAYWEHADGWSYDDAALRGSSYLKLPQPLQFLTGNIGLHHVHHLSARIPNYNLQAAHDGNSVFRSVPVLTLRQGLRATRLKLWDERARRLVTFAEGRRLSAPTAAGG
ncbi:fatty acid desaturase [Conexibacter stalactiti]|uniref:Fatty acid desaturase n=1 Tax=Conexibacter stalactiti TaxID=1940611 RepID=A0ABU4HZA7_9ACTN|nr:fatty acid desaturase [Conexibacter stalactiti]MDW5598042.1 fatty acid desaturase [Conexibacter stalactiti]MEC5038684.1 fatty acid desaturase [Conexibacter stalactiti]